MDLQPTVGRELDPGMFPSGERKEALCERHEQEKLSGVVKRVHRKLRRKYIEETLLGLVREKAIFVALCMPTNNLSCRKSCNTDYGDTEAMIEAAVLKFLDNHAALARVVGDFETIWREHCEDEQTLNEYAFAMKSLADNHWAKKCDGEGRIEWCRSVCQEYFMDGGMKKMLEKDAKASIHAAAASGTSLNPDTSQPSLVFWNDKLRLLDVGSCFNPFLKFDEFLTVGIDIVPAVESVYKCDFLNLQLQQPLQLASDAHNAFLRQLRDPIETLPGQLFHVVVFSLLLSYFPSPYQRWLCCKKAHELLTLHGLLLIITPDSSHQGRHALMMRSWRVAIESLGFRRYKYVKFSHMHMLAFRKVSLTTSSDLVSHNYPEMLYIPQDFGALEEDDAFGDSCQPLRSDSEDEQLARSFTELPEASYDSDSGESQSGSAPFHELEDPILLYS